MEQETNPLYLRFYRSMMQLKHLGRKMPAPKHGLSHLEFMTLSMIRRYREEHPELPGMKISLLSEVTHLSRPAISQNVNNLEDRGYVVRISSRSDRRVTYLALTEEAEELLRDCRETMLAHVKRMCELLGEEDAEAVIALSDKIARVMTVITEEEKQQEPEGSSERPAKGGCV